MRQPLTGQRYLLTEAIGDSDNATPASAWGSLVASVNDIIQYNGTSWEVVFDASERTPDYSSNITDFVTNTTTSVQYKWTGAMWVKSYQGLIQGRRMESSTLNAIGIWFYAKDY